MTQAVDHVPVGLFGLGGRRYRVFAVDRGLVGSITVTLGNYALGAWWFDSGRFQFATTAFNRSEYSVCSVDEVVLATKEIAAKHAMYLSYQEHGITLHANGMRPA